MATEINKGRISVITGNTAKIIPATASSSVTRPLVIPWYLRGEMGGLAIGMEVVYCVFDDMTGIIMERADGEWPGEIQHDIKITGSVEHEGTVTAKAAVTVANNLSVGGIAMESHKHTGNMGADTSGPH